MKQNAAEQKFQSVQWYPLNMKPFRSLLFPFIGVIYLVDSLRNWDQDYLTSDSHDFWLFFLL